MVNNSLKLFLQTEGLPWNRSPSCLSHCKTRTKYLKSTNSSLQEKSVGASLQPVLLPLLKFIRQTTSSSTRQ